MQAGDGGHVPIMALTASALRSLNDWLARYGSIGKASGPLRLTLFRGFGP
jgi:hypothetical protein